MERLLNICDATQDMRPLYEMFDKAVLDTRQVLEFSEEESIEKKGYVRLQKVTITPTRYIFDTPELVMANRVLRAMPDKFPPQKFLRVSFRDDDMSRIQPNIGEWFIKQFVLYKLLDGIKVAGKFF